MVLLTLTAIAAGTAGAGVTWSRCLPEISCRQRSTVFQSATRAVFRLLTSHVCKTLAMPREQLHQVLPEQSSR